MAYFITGGTGFLGRNFIDKLKLVTSSVRQTKNVSAKPTRPKKPKSKSAIKLYNAFVDVITSVKRIQVNYTENNGTFLPGYIPEFGLLGQSNYNGTFAPTFGFVFGSQADILDKAIRNGWLISRGQGDNFYARNYSRSHYDKFDYSANVKFRSRVGF